MRYNRLYKDNDFLTPTTYTQELSEYGWARRPEPSCRPGGAVRSARWWSGPR